MADFEVAADPGAAPVLVVAGDIDMSTEAELLAACEELLATGAPVVEIDLAGVTFIDSSGLGALVHVQRTTEQEGRELRLVHPPRPVTRLLEVTGLTALFTVRPTA